MIELHSISEAGGHPVNEDAFLIREHPAEAGCWFGCIADGQGGRAGGARAAHLACEVVMRIADRTPVGMLASARGWGYLLLEADREVAADAEAGFTTLVGLCIRRGRIVGASNGDSAALLVNQSGSEILTERQPKNPPVGSGAAAFAEFTAELGESWRVLAMTDGVWKYVGWDRIGKALREKTGRSALDELRQMAALPHTSELQDDFTAILLTEAIDA
jgi:PPM family protein phosphatase